MFYISDTAVPWTARTCPFLHFTDSSMISDHIWPRPGIKKWPITKKNHIWPRRGESLEASPLEWRERSSAEGSRRAGRGSSLKVWKFESESEKVQSEMLKSESERVQTEMLKFESKTLKWKWKTQGGQGEDWAWNVEIYLKFESWHERIEPRFQTGMLRYIQSKFESWCLDV